MSPMAEEIPRGIRLNNPCNIRISPNEWHGKINPSTDPDFEQFDSPIDGLRAAAKLFLNYYRFDGLSTVTQLIGRWAPSNENDTDAYVDDVCCRVAVGPHDPIDVTQPSVLQSLLAATVVHENGQDPYDEATIAQAVSEAYAI